MTRNDQNAWIASGVLHVVVLLLLVLDLSSPTTPTAMSAAPRVASQTMPTQQVEPIKAVSVDADELMKTVDALKQKAALQKQAEVNHQRALEKQAAEARQQRIAEQKKVLELKQEAARIAIAKKKQIEDEKKRLKQVALQKQIEEKRLAEMKKKQAIEAAKLAELSQKKAAELAKAQKTLAEQKQKAAQEAQRLAAAKTAAAVAETNARIAGEVDRYKALIISAISRQWILPETAKSGISSEFRIRLAPDGSVLEVTLTRGSGDPLLDRSAQSAIYKASPLPVPTDAAAFNIFRDITLTVKPENARG